MRNLRMRAAAAVQIPIIKLRIKTKLCSLMCFSLHINSRIIKSCLSSLWVSSISISSSSIIYVYLYSFSCNNGSDGVDDNDNSINKESRIIAKYSIEPFNNYIYKDNYHLNFSYYKRECSKVLNGENKKKEGIIKRQLDFDLFSNDKPNLLEGEFETINRSNRINNRRKEDVRRSIDDFQVDNRFLLESINQNDTPTIISTSFDEDDSDDLPFN